MHALIINAFQNILFIIIQYGTTALMLACREGHTEIVKMLMARPGIEVNVQMKVGDACTPSVVSFNGFVSLSYLSLYWVSLDTPLSKQSSALHHFCIVVWNHGVARGSVQWFQ